MKVVASFRVGSGVSPSARRHQCENGGTPRTEPFIHSELTASEKRRRETGEGGKGMEMGSGAPPGRLPGHDRQT